jgi:hypothetical protein
VIFGSLREHTRIQFSTQTVDLGPALSVHGEGWIPNTRTTARVEGIRKSPANRSKVDIADIQMFLAGFDAGELYALGREDVPSRSNQGAQHIQQEPLESLGPHLS